ncbi:MULTISPECIES: GPW/gp25 family protein [Arsenophonus]|uniref:GPW/gp25 family protein n=1 Tax=Arsenophonus TaxID=637 RepID=UPI0015D72F87|nr:MULTISPECIES: GPW/gp25 family protein [Arsenophonus]UBX30091.1 GPW/gp25 family protein [Arsenophonus apicola]
MNALGMNRQTGQFISENAHIAQSVQDILLTPVGSRVMRRDYGSLLFSLLDKPQTPALRLQLMAACFSALLRFEPRIRLEKINIEQHAETSQIAIVAQIIDSGTAFSFHFPVRSR